MTTSSSSKTQREKSNFYYNNEWQYVTISLSLSCAITKTPSYSAKKLFVFLCAVSLRHTAISVWKAHPRTIALSMRCHFQLPSRHWLPWCLSDSVLRRVSGGILIILWQKTSEKSSLLPRLCECQCGHKQKNLPPEWFVFLLSTVATGCFYLLLVMTSA